MKNIELKNNLILYNQNPAGFIKENQIIMDKLFQTEELSQWIVSQGYVATWQEGVFETLALHGRYDEVEEKEPMREVRIWQLKDSFEYSGRFLAYDSMVATYGEPVEANYQCVYEGNMETNDLEEIYTKCNCNHPEGYRGHSLSMSDVVEIYDQRSSDYYYVDRFGFKEVKFKEEMEVQEMEVQEMEVQEMEVQEMEVQEMELQRK